MNGLALQFSHSLHYLHACWFLVCAQFLLPYIYLYHSYTQPDASFPEILVIMHFAVMLPQRTEFLCRTSHVVTKLLHMLTSPR